MSPLPTYALQCPGLLELKKSRAAERRFRRWRIISVDQIDMNSSSRGEIALIGKIGTFLYVDRANELRLRGFISRGVRIRDIPAG